MNSYATDTGSFLPDVFVPPPSPVAEADVLRLEILRRLEGREETIQPCGYHVLLALYVRAAYKDLGNGKVLHYSDTTRKEDELQGRVALVIALGPDAYSDRQKFPNGAWVKPGDWVLFSAYEAAPTKLTFGDGLVLAAIADDRLVMRTTSPQLVK